MYMNVNNNSLFNSIQLIDYLLTIYLLIYLSIYLSPVAGIANKTEAAHPSNYSD